MSLFKTKAETLAWLGEKGFPVPEVTHFSVGDWENCPEEIVRAVYEKFAETGLCLAVRSSAQNEDTAGGSQAGAFRSVLSVPGSSVHDIVRAVFEVKNSLNDNDDLIFVQPMVENVTMSGVIMTRHLDDGSPYYVINYDETSGRTDTVTGGIGVNKTVFIYNGVRDRDFDSDRLKLLVTFAQSLENVFEGEPLDIEFALDASAKFHLLQVRRICTGHRWKPEISGYVNARIAYVESFIRSIEQPRCGLYGKSNILGVMPDWNPAEMIGITPRPLALSLYRELITRRTWSRARERMGYRLMPSVELMLSVGGRPYIDVRASFNSFLPQGLSPEISERLVNAWIDRLNANPNFHDKVEFEVVHTALEPDLEQGFAARYPGLLSTIEFEAYRAALAVLSNRALMSGGTLDAAMAQINQLREMPETDCSSGSDAVQTANPFDVALRIGTTLEQCREQGTLPFAVIARHAFIAESLLRSAVRCGAIEPDRVSLFKRSIQTISGELTEDFRAVCAGQAPKDVFLRKYGHLRPGSYDIMSPSYAELEGLFSVAVNAAPEAPAPHFVPTPKEKAALDKLLASGGLQADAGRLFAYARQAVAGREYAKFIFTRHLSHILNLAAAWGAHFSLDREEVSMLGVHEILDSISNPLYKEAGHYFKERIQAARHEYEIMRSFKLSYIIRSPRDVYIVPQHRSAPNFITTDRVQAPVALLDGRTGASAELASRIVCIESADPGFDWIFTRNIAGLITKYGGANSHMAIRCAEYGLPAAIGCGEQLFEQIAGAENCLLDCGACTITPIGNALSGAGV